MDKIARTDPRPQPLTLALAATFTAQALQQPLDFWFEELDLAGRVAFAPYNQLFQQLLDPSSVLSTNQHGVNVLLLRLEDWQRVGVNPDNPEDDTDSRSDVHEKAAEFLTAIRAAVRRLPVPFLVVFCPASPRGTSNIERRPPSDPLEQELAVSLAQIPGIDVVSSTELMDAYPATGYYDSQGDKIAHLPYTPVFSTAIATVIARWLHGLTQAGYKAIVVDCDDTLWTGTCGEDGPHGVTMDAARVAMQEYLVGLHDRGVLVCLCSRNNEADVLAVFDARSTDMPLKRHHVVSSRFNWGRKSDNICALADELQLSPDAFVFLDDNPVECAEVQANCPDVLVIQVPRDRETIPGVLRNLWIFDSCRATDEARARTALYSQNIARARVQNEAPSLSDFLARLDLKVHVADVTPPQVARASELTQRTNQFNVTTIRRSDAEIEAVRQQGATCLAVQAKDRFGNYGIVGLIIFSLTSEALVVDTFLLSCRALGKGIEHRMLSKLGDIAIDRGVSRVDLPFVWSGRNEPARDFLNTAAAAFQEADGLNCLCRIPAAVAAQARYRPEERAPGERTIAAGPVPERASSSREKAATLMSIARNLRDLDEIHAQVSARTGTRPNIEREYVAPRTPTEQTIAAILAQVLGVDRVGVDDNFFELGGHSLLAMQVLFRIREAFHVELSARLLYNSAFTTADLATRVLQSQVDAAGPQRIEALLERLNELSDDEVRALLAREMDPSQQPPEQ